MTPTIPAAPARTGRRRRLRLPPRTLRARLAIFYFGAFTLLGVLLLGTTVGYWQSTTAAQVGAVRAGQGGHRAPGGPSANLQATPGHAPQVVQHSTDQHHLLVGAGTALGLMVALSVGFGWVAAGRILRPLRAITSATRRISATNLHERLNLSGPADELKELGDTFDELLGRLERSFQLERQFVANASHELRTPLATMRASIDVAVAKPGPPPPQLEALALRLRRELDQVERLLESFLTLAEAQNRGPVHRTAVLLDDAVDVAIERRAAAARLLGLRIEHRRCPGARVSADTTLVQRLVDNLVDNAIKHNQAGGWARVTTLESDGQGGLVVENGGPLLRPEDVGALARPFQRLGPQRTGSDNGNGLGLSIVKSIAEAHGGRLYLEARQDGGLRATVQLPAAAPQGLGQPA